MCTMLLDKGLGLYDEWMLPLGTGAWQGQLNQCLKLASTNLKLFLQILQDTLDPSNTSEWEEFSRRVSIDILGSFFVAIASTFLMWGMLNMIVATPRWMLLVRLTWNK